MGCDDKLGVIFTLGAPVFQTIISLLLLAITGIPTRLLYLCDPTWFNSCSTFAEHRLCLCFLHLCFNSQDLEICLKFLFCHDFGPLVY